MKNYILTALLALNTLSFNLSAQIKTSLQEVGTAQLAEKREALKEAIIFNYLGVKNSLIKSDSVQAIKYATAFASLMDQFKFKKLSLAQMNEATTTREEIKKLALEIAGTKSINMQRKEMDKLSVKMWSIIERFKPEKTTLYKQVCPMTGTTWISNDKAIENPYYPKNMLTCGEVKASI